MSQSTNGQICFGSMYEEDFEFPWDAAPFDGDDEQWWRHVNGYENPNFNPYTSNGDYKDGVKQDDPRIDTWFAYQRAWDAAHPFPVKMVNYCSGDYPMWILAVPSSFRDNNRGYAERFDPADLKVADEEKQALEEFCIKYDLAPEEDAGWYLTSYWG